MTIHYRRPSPDEAAAMAALHVQCWSEAYRGIVPDEVLDTIDMEDRAQRWRNYLATEDNTFTLAAYDGHRLIGFVRSGAIAEPLVPDADGHIHAIYILARYHRRGIGRHLLKAALRDWALRGGTAMSVGVLSANRRARSFYEALGGALALETVYDWAGHKLPECIYVYRGAAAFP